MPKVSTHLAMGNVQLLSVEYGINEKFSAGDSFEVKISPEVNVRVRKSKETKEAMVSLELKLFKKNSSEYPMWLKIKNQAEFRWDTDNGNVDVMLRTLCAAHLLSYMRPLVTQLTTMSDLPPLTLPLINFHED